MTSPTKLDPKCDACGGDDPENGIVCGYCAIGTMNPTATHDPYGRRGE